MIQCINDDPFPETFRNFCYMVKTVTGKRERTEIAIVPPARAFDVDVDDGAESHRFGRVVNDKRYTMPPEKSRRYGSRDRSVRPSMYDVVCRTAHRVVGIVDHIPDIHNQHLP